LPIFKNIAMKNIFPKSFGQANKSLGTIGQVAGGLQMLTGMAGQASKYMDTSGITQQGSEYEDITRGNIGQAIDIQQDQASFGTIATDAASSAISGMATFGPLGAIAGLAPIITGVLGNDAKKKAWNDTMNSERSLRMTKQRQFNEQDLRTGMANQFAYGGQFNSPLTEFNAGGTHEQNPNNGIMQGMGSNGQPNFVEEGETKYNDYIYSNRLSIDDSIVKAYNLPTKVKGKTFAEATKILNEQVKERPNDPISLKTLEANMSKLAQAQDDLKATIEQDAGVNEAIDNLGFSEEIFAKGGSLNFKSNAAYKKWLGYVHATGKAESTPGHQSVSIKGKSHEVKHQLGGALYNELDALKNSGIFAYGGNMYATRGQLDLPKTSAGDDDEIAKEINLNEITITPEIPIYHAESDYGVEEFTPKPLSDSEIMDRTEYLPDEEELQPIKVERGGDNNGQLNYAMFAPIFANAMQGISTAFEKPAVEKYGRVAPELITSRMSYRPLSTEYLSNQIQSQGAGVRRSIQESAPTGGSAMRGILASNRATSDALSQAYFQAEAAREARRAAVESGNIRIQGQNVASKNAAASQNAQIRMAEVIANMQNRAARNNALRGFAATMGNDLGQIGRMMYASKTGQAMTGYDTDPFGTGKVKYR